MKSYAEFLASVLFGVVIVGAFTQDAKYTATFGIAAVCLGSTGFFYARFFGE